MILIAGATGYIGGRLLQALEQAGQRVRCLARRPEYLASRVAGSTVVVQGDCLEAASLAPVLDGVDAAYYLVHSMGSGADFEQQDREAARNFGAAAKRPVCGGSCFSAGWAVLAIRSRRISGAGTRPAKSFSHLVFP